MHALLWELEIRQPKHQVKTSYESLHIHHQLLEGRSYRGVKALESSDTRAEGEALRGRWKEVLVVANSNASPGGMLL